jgi:acetoin utilization deacetylase AcuC-like enzyme
LNAQNLDTDIALPTRVHCLYVGFDLDFGNAAVDGFDGNFYHWLELVSRGWVGLEHGWYHAGTQSGGGVVVAGIAQVRAYSSSQYAMPLPAGHKFPMGKYAGVRYLLEQAGLTVLEPPRVAWELVERVHDIEYLKKLRFGTLSQKEVRLLGFPWSEQMVERALRASGGTLEAARDALCGGLGINLAGGTHHAYPDHGEGFCVLNDVAIAIRALQLERVVVLDLDVHQGNGTAAIFAEDPKVLTISVHGERNYPFRKERSSLDIGLPDGVDDAAYLAVLEQQVLPVLQRFQPQLVFYLAGVDVLHNDQFGRFALSLKGAMARDARVFGFCKHLGIPVVSLMAGGYNKNLEKTISAHANTVLAALGVWGFDLPATAR